MEKIIYHGSDHIIKVPQYGAGREYNDYGKGFYCTENLALAKEWGASQYKDGFVNQYKIECDELSILQLNAPGYTILHWLAILLENRTFDGSSPLAKEAKKYLQNNFLIDYSSADIITGYRADDSYFSFASDFVNGVISYRQLSNAMYLGKLGQQFVIKSAKAFERLQFLGYQIAPKEEWFPKRIQRDQKAKDQYFDVERNQWKRGDIYITHILEEGMMPNDPRLQ